MSPAQRHHLSPAVQVRHHDHVRLMRKYIQEPVVPVIMQAGDILQEPWQGGPVCQRVTHRQRIRALVRHVKPQRFFLLRHHQGMLSPPLGKAFKTGIVAVPVHIQRQAVCCRREDGRAAVNAVGGERPFPLPGQGIAVPAEVFDGLKIVIAV